MEGSGIRQSQFSGSHGVSLGSTPTLTLPGSCLQL